MQAANFFEQVADLLRGQANINDPTAQRPNDDIANSVPLPTTISTPARQNTNQASLSRLFGYRSTRAPGIRARRQALIPWEHHFFCLEEPGQITIPNVQETTDLQRRGLGRKVIVFPNNQGSHLDFSNRLFEAYPPLRNCGGFKLMRSCRSRILIEIPMPLDGYSLPFVRFCSGLNRAVAYIVPLQRKLSSNEEVPRISEELVVKEVCQKCNHHIPLQIMELHSMSCGQSTAVPPPNEETATVQPVLTVPIRVGLILDTDTTTYTQRRAQLIQKLYVPINHNESALISAMRSSFPKLGNKPFELCRVDTHKKIHVLELPKMSSIALRAMLKNGRSAVYIRPKERLDETSEDDDSDSDEADSDNSELSPGASNEASASSSVDMNEEQELEDSEWINAGTPDVYFRVSPARDESEFDMESQEQNQEDENPFLQINREVDPGDSSGSTILNNTVEPLLTPSDSTIVNNNTDPDLKELLKTLRSAVDFEEAAPFSNTINAVRNNILESGMRAFGRRTFNPLRKVDVVFVDTCGNGEGSVDDGGPTREFLRLLMKAILASRFFVGPQDNKSLALDALGLSKGTYKVLGLMMAVSLIHGGVGPLVLSHRLFAQLTGLPRPTMDVSDIDDPELREVLEKIQTADSLEDVRTAVWEGTTILSLLGALAPIQIMQDRDDIVQSAMQFYLEGRQEAALTQVKEGLRALGVLEAMTLHPAEFQKVFCGGAPKLTASCLIGLFRVHFSPAGCNRRRLEEVAIGQWRDWLIDVEGGDASIDSEVEGGEPLSVTLEDVLVFASGASAIPPFGFKEMPSISFLTDLVNGVRRVYPEANTCDITLKLPLHNAYDEFSRYMILGIIQSPTFGVS